MKNHSTYIERPNIFLLSRPVLDWRSIKKLLSDQRTSWKRSTGATAAEETVELGGRMCYMSFGDAQSSRTTTEYIQNLIRKGHESVLEHATWTFAIVGISRAFSHQLVRHRVGFAFSQLSQQYHDETNANFVIPEPLRGHPEVSGAWCKLVEDSRDAYRTILVQIENAALPEAGKAERLRAMRSAARSVLPNATETKIVVTANARAIRHFLHVRGNIVGDPEMRRVSVLLLRLMRAEAPAMFADFRVCKLSDGSPSVEMKEPR